MNIQITHIDTACILLDINGYQILTDPTLDNSGRWYHHGYGSVSRKTDDPALPVSALSGVDLILLSHHQHKDNFDLQGKAFTRKARLVLTTKNAASTMTNALGLEKWETHAIDDPRLPGLRITATPAQHRPWWIPEFISGKVIGFIIEYEGQQNGAIYISGDTVYFKGIDQVASRYRVDLGIFHVGSVQFRYLTGFAQYTMDGRAMLKAAKAIQPNRIIPVHFRGWTHFKEKEQTLRSVLSADKQLTERTIFLVPGERTRIY